MPTHRPRVTTRAARRRARAAAGALALSLAAAPGAPVGAQAPVPAPASAREGNRFGGVAGLHVGVPQKASIMLGAGYWRLRDGGGDEVDIAFAAVEPGLGAGRASVGYFRGGGNLLAGVAVRASALRTWRDPWSVAPNRTYVGLEASGHAVLSLRVGVFRRVTDAPGRQTIVTWDVGLLF